MPIHKTFIKTNKSLISKYKSNTISLISRNNYQIELV